MSSANDLIPSYSFEVTLDSVSFSFSKVSNICGNIQYDSYVEGGVNDAPVIFRKPKSTPDTLILERGVTDSIKGKVFAVIKEGCKISEIQINVLKNGKRRTKTENRSSIKRAIIKKETIGNQMKNTSTEQHRSFPR